MYIRREPPLPREAESCAGGISFAAGPSSRCKPATASGTPETAASRDQLFRIISEMIASPFTRRFPAGRVPVSSAIQHRTCLTHEQQPNLQPVRRVQASHRAPGRFRPRSKDHDAEQDQPLCCPCGRLRSPFLGRAEGAQAHLARQEVTESYPLPHRLRRKRRQWLMAHLSGWSWAGGEGALVAPAAVTAEQLHDLVNRTFMDGGLIRDIHGLNVAIARVREDNVVPAII